MFSSVIHYQLKFKNTFNISKQNKCCKSNRSKYLQNIFYYSLFIYEGVISKIQIKRCDLLLLAQFPPFLITERMRLMQLGLNIYIYNKQWDKGCNKRLDFYIFLVKAFNTLHWIIFNYKSWKYFFEMAKL